MILSHWEHIADSEFVSHSNTYRKMLLFHVWNCRLWVSVEKDKTVKIFWFLVGHFRRDGKKFWRRIWIDTALRSCERWDKINATSPQDAQSLSSHESSLCQSYNIVGCGQSSLYLGIFFSFCLHQFVQHIFIVCLFCASRWQRFHLSLKTSVGANIPESLFFFYFTFLVDSYKWPMKSNDK